MDKQLWETVYIAPPHEERREGSCEGASKILMLMRHVSGALVSSKLDKSGDLLVPEAERTHSYSSCPLLTTVRCT